MALVPKSDKSFKPLFDLVGCFLEHEGEILLLHRHIGKTQGGKWGMPAGKVKKGENLKEAMVRETLEETGHGVEPDNLRYFNNLWITHPEHDFVYHIFHALLPARPKVKINDYEHKGFIWIKPGDVFKLKPLVDDLTECIEMFYTLTPDGSVRENR